MSAATSVTEAGPGAIVAFDRLVTVSRWELVVPAWTLMPSVGSGSENSWYVGQGGAPDLEIPITIGLDEDGRFRELAINSDEFAAHVHERFGVTDRRAKGGFEFEIVVKSFDIEAFPVTHLEVPAESMRQIDTEQYLSGIDRPTVGLCVGSYGELSLPIFEEPRPCERGVMVLGPLPGSVDDGFPGYTELQSEALDGCAALADEVLGAGYVDEWGIIVRYSVASPVVWDIGQDPVVCGASPGWSN